MAKRPLIEATKREQKGSHSVARLRKEGAVPAIIYGSGAPVEMISVSHERMREIIEARSRTVDLKLGSKSQSAIVKDVQYDHLGSDVFHVDFERIELSETVRVEVSIETHGVAKGTRLGGVLEVVHKHVSVECKAGDIPNEVVVEIADLDIDQFVTIGQLQIPEGVKVLDDPAAICVVVHPPRKEVDVTAEAEAGAELAEPEVIGAKKEEEESGEES